MISIAVLVYFILRGAQYIRKEPGSKRKIWLALRLLAVLCLLLNLIKLEWIQIHSSNTTIFVIDRSLSVSQYSRQIESYINSQLINKKKKEKVGIISFGKEPMIEKNPTEEIQHFKMETKPEEDFTNIERALTFAIDCFPDDSNKRLVLFTDGKENMGQVESLSNVLKNQNVQLLIYPLKAQEYDDAQLFSISLPHNLYKEEKGRVEVVVNANMEEHGTFYLQAGDKKIVEEPIAVRKGKNYFQFVIPSIKGTGNIQYTGTIDFPQDSNPHNNTFTTTVSVTSDPKILVLGAKADIENINRLLEGLSIEYTASTAAQTPDGIDFLAGFDAVMLVNTSHQEISYELENNLERCVKEQGLGLILIGGEKTFALGGYENSLLESMLPLESRMKGNKKQPNTGLILAIDCSGSMEEESGGIKKLEMAKEAALRSLEILEEEDAIGILGFSDQVEWIVPYQAIKNKSNIENQVKKLAAKGGTLILPGLKAAQEELAVSDTKIKHIILLSDGQGEREGFDSILKEMKEERITLSTVAVGQDAEKELLEKLSQTTGGRAYAAVEIHQIPEIFTKETYLATKKYINERRFLPEIVQKTEYFSHQTLPPLEGYIGTGLKERAQLILQSDMEDPILALWQYGLGKVVAWTPDMAGKWSGEWLQWKDFQEQWGKLINLCLTPRSGKNVEIEMLQKGSHVPVYVKVKEEESIQSMRILLQGPENFYKEIALQQIRIGEFSGDILLDKTGEYSLTFFLHKDGQAFNVGTRILHLNYSPEYDVVIGDPLAIFEKIPNSQKIEEDTRIFDLAIDRSERSKKPLDFILLPLALLIFIVDIWYRKK